jgi:hypothetical protein
LGGAKVLQVGTNEATRLDYDATNDQVIVEAIPFDDEVFTGRYDRTAALDSGDYRAYRSTNGFDQYIADEDESASGAVRSAVVGSDRYLDHGYGGSTYQRNGNVTIPSTTQRAFYNGDYVGLRTIATGGSMDVIDGDVRMEVDFSDDTVRGRIINRTTRHTVTSPGSTPTTGTGLASTITFANTTLNRTNGSFTGGIATTGYSGSYEGVLADGTGSATEMVGITTLNEGDYRERGTFIAIQ